jgi:hypothetical protein
MVIMELKEILDYIEEKHNIKEMNRWDSSSIMSRLCHPLTGKMIALIIRQWDSDSGMWMEHCDLKYDASLYDRMKSYIVEPLRMHGSNWIGICFNKDTESDYVFDIFDKAILQENPAENIIILDDTKSKLSFTETHATDKKSSGISENIEFLEPAEKKVYTDSILTFTKGREFFKDREEVPKKIREMMALYKYDDYSWNYKARNFYKQAKFMEDYEDDYQGEVGEISGYYTTYHDLNEKQLRAYFTWRSEIRKGIYNKACTSFIYIYIYELLCGIDASSSYDTVNKLKTFEEKLSDKDILDVTIKRNLHKWYFEYSLLHGFSIEKIKEYVDKDVFAQDSALDILKNYKKASDEEIFESICFFAGKKGLNSVSLKKERDKSIFIFAFIWRYILKNVTIEGKGIFSHCFGRIHNRSWYPLFNAVYWSEKKPENGDYIVNGVRSYHYHDGSWNERGYIKSYFNKKKIDSIFHEIDRKIREEFKLGYYLGQRPDDSWIRKDIEDAFGKAIKELKKNERAKINIDFSALKKIRIDAESTKESLLIDEEKETFINTEVSRVGSESDNESETKNGLFNRGIASEDKTGEIYEVLDISDKDRDMSFIKQNKNTDINTKILKHIIEEKDYKQLIKSNNLFASIVTDTINEIFFEKIGDNILECEGDDIYLIEDYREDILDIIGDIYE